MAKSGLRTGPSSNSRIRFIMLEADLADGDLTQITQAITNALGRTTGPTRALSAPPKHQVMPPTPELSTDGSETAAEDEDFSDEEQNGDSAVKSKKPRRISSPKVLDIDLSGTDLPFVEFATKANPSSVLKKHLAAAYWLKVHGNIVPVTADHAYTCYKKAGWGTGIKDFMQPFRDLQRAGNGEVKDSKFTINQIGEDVVEKLLKPGK